MTLSPRLGKFRKKSENLFNCRCPVCGDSTTNVNKARGYFYKQRNDLFYKCHNCSASKHFGTFLKDFDPTLYKEYVFERYAKGEPAKKSHAKVEKVMKKAVEPFSATRTFERLAQRLDTLPADHEAIAYCNERKIAKSKFPLLYVLSMADVLTIAPQYKKRIGNGPSRLAMPFYNLKGELTGISLRTLHNEALRYLIIRLTEDEQEPLIFGLQKIDSKKTLYVVEGAIDSLFLPNSIACNGTSFGKIDQLGLPAKKIVVVIDNQPRNKEVCRTYEKYITAGYSVVIWPETLQEKDLNEMFVAGKDPVKLVRQNIYQGIAATAAIMKWRRC